MTTTSSPVQGFDGSVRLPQFMLNGKWVTFAGNHNIPQSLFTDPLTGGLKTMFDALKTSGWFDAASFAQNGTPLPNTRPAADAVGNQGQYTDFMAR